jgi:hypothetical protein
MKTLIRILILFILLTCSITAIYGQISTNTTLLSNNNPSCENSTIIFTATVDQPTATGTMQFLDDATILGSTDVTNRVATFTIATLSSGDHLITAVYSGDLNFNPSTSPSLLQKINAVPKATISYTGAPWCNSTTVQTVTLTGTTGGTFTALPAGLSIDAVTGTITPNTSSAGTYTVTYTIAAAGGCSEVTATASVTITTLPVATISYTGAPWCNSATVQTVTLTGTTGGTFTALPAGLSIDAVTGTITPNTSSAGTYTVTYTIAATSGCSVVTATTSVSINPNLSVGVVVTASANPVCTGTSITFTAIPTNGGTAPVYQWKVNSANVGINSSAYFYAPTNNDLITCVMTSNATCAAGSPSTSNVINMNIDPTSVGGTVSGGTTVCSGSTSAQLTLSGQTGTVVKWQSSVAPFSTWNDIANTATTYTSGALTQTTQFRAVVQSGVCSPANSTPATVTVDPTSVGGSLSAGVTQIFLGQSTGSITLTAYTGIVVKWQKRVNAASIWTEIANTLTTYSETPNAVGIWEYRAVVQSGSCGPTNSASINIEVLASNAGAVTGGSSPICLGSSTGTMTLSGNTGTIVKWQKRVDAASIWTDIVNTETTYVETPSNAGTWEYRAVTNSGTDLYSAPSTIFVYPISIGGTVSGGSTVCSGNTSGQLTLSGQTGTVVKWQSSVAPFISWNDIANTATTYTSGVLTQTTQFRAVVQSGVCSPANSSPATVTIDPTSIGGTVSGGTTVCSGSTSAQLTLSGQTGTVVKWQSSVAPFSTWNDIANTATTYTSGALTQTTQFRAVVQSGVCSPANSTPATVTVDPLSIATINGSTSVCEGNTGINYNTEAGMTAYSWVVSAGGLITSGASTNSITVNWKSAGAQTVTVNYLNNSGCNSVSAAVKDVLVNPIPGNALSINGTTEVCGGVQGVVYLTSSIPNAATYVWTLPSGASIASGSGTSSITVNFASNATSGNIAVYGNNLCGDGNRSILDISVAQPPGVAGSITGPSTFAPGATGMIYSVDPIANATSYTWTLPVGVSIISGENTNTITVDFNMSTVAGNFTVYGSNSCGNGTISPTFTVTIPEAKFLIYPVPNDGYFTAKITTPVETSFTIMIFDQTGRKIYEIRDAQTLNGVCEKVIDLGPIPSGIYYLEFINSDFKEVRKVLINRK